MITTILFQHMKIMPKLSLDQETLAKPITCSNYMKNSDKRPIHIITRSPNQYPNYKTTIEIKLINKYKGLVVIIDGMLGARNGP